MDHEALKKILGIVILDNNFNIKKHIMNLDFVNILFRKKIENKIVGDCKDLVEALYEKEYEKGYDHEYDNKYNDTSTTITMVHIDGEIGESLKKHNLNDVVCHYLKKDYIYCIVTHNYFSMTIIKKIMDELNSALYLEVVDLKYVVEKYEDMETNVKRDKVAEIQDELNETVDVLKISMEKLLSRGETLEELIEKTENLREVSFKFQKQARKLNSCCMIL
jgi:hypothetical protein